MKNLLIALALIPCALFGQADYTESILYTGQENDQPVIELTAADHLEKAGKLSLGAKLLYVAGSALIYFNSDADADFPEMVYFGAAVVGVGFTLDLSAANQTKKAGLKLKSDK
jgi:hypothetical protein